tara:strand:+ start:204 stop:356 length:153 start_codon:yes stop_codon:yes gene_type:complete
VAVVVEVVNTQEVEALEALEKIKHLFVVIHHPLEQRQQVSQLQQPLIPWE